MAPRAEFEVDCKLLSAQGPRASRDLSTPSDTPRYKLLWQWIPSAPDRVSELILTQ